MPKGVLVKEPYLAKSLNVHYIKLSLLTTRVLYVVRGLSMFALVLGCVCVSRGG